MFSKNEQLKCAWGLCNAPAVEKLWVVRQCGCSGSMALSCRVHLQSQEGKSAVAIVCDQCGAYNHSIAFRVEQLVNSKQ